MYEARSNHPKRGTSPRTNLHPPGEMVRKHPGDLSQRGFEGPFAPTFRGRNKCTREPAEPRNRKPKASALLGAR